MVVGLPGATGSTAGETILTIARANGDIEERQKIIRLLKKAGAKNND